jgi:hypothetical protein
MAGQRRPNPLDTRGTNRIYGSSQPSALAGSRTEADSKQVEPGTAQQQRAKHNALDTRSTDRYYREASQQRPANKPQARLSPTPAPATKLLIETAEDVGPVMVNVAALINSGSEPLTVYIAEGQAELLRRARTALDLQITREVITADQGRDVRFTYVATTLPRMEAPPAPAPGVSPHEDDEDPPIDTSPVTPTVIEEPEDGQDFTFLQEVPVAVSAAKTVEELVTETTEEQEPAVTQDSEVKKPGKRSGRGA